MADTFMSAKEKRRCASSICGFCWLNSFLTRMRVKILIFFISAKFCSNSLKHGGTHHNTQLQHMRYHYEAIDLLYSTVCLNFYKFQKFVFLAAFLHLAAFWAQMRLQAPVVLQRHHFWIFWKKRRCYGMLGTASSPPVLACRRAMR